MRVTDEQRRVGRYARNMTGVGALHGGGGGVRARSLSSNRSPLLPVYATRRRVLRRPWTPGGQFFNPEWPLKGDGVPYFTVQVATMGSGRKEQTPWGVSQTQCSFSREKERKEGWGGVLIGCGRGYHAEPRRASKTTKRHPGGEKKKTGGDVHLEEEENR